MVAVKGKEINTLLYPLQMGKEIMDLHCIWKYSAWKFKQTFVMLKTDESSNTPPWRCYPEQVRQNSAAEGVLGLPFVRWALQAFCTNLCSPMQRLRGL